MRIFLVYNSAKGNEKGTLWQAGEVGARKAEHCEARFCQGRSLSALTPAKGRNGEWLAGVLAVSMAASKLGRDKLVHFAPKWRKLGGIAPGCARFGVPEPLDEVE